MLVEGDRKSMMEDEAQAARSSGRDIHPSLWYSAKELDWIARDHARRQKIDFSFSGVDTQIWVPRSRNYLARVEYSSGIGHPVLMVTIGWNGEVMDHLKALAVDSIETRVGSNQSTVPDGVR